ncbi:MotA/TolQ/ExbB proton channel family protein [Haliangium sp.]|uniref:MotA/TolQ/ExbB proton channel family protein n=1 Tax=Haliangium sp. TaxID=2663208 RepID=UPI003D13E06F
MELSLLELLAQAPILVQVTWGVLTIMSVGMLYFGVDRFRRYRQATKQTYSFVLALKDYLDNNRTEDALKASRKHKDSPVAKTVEAGLVAYKQGREALKQSGPEDVGEFDLVDSVNRSLERVKEREVSSLRKGLGALASMASVAPFVGLFGTTIGIIGAFGKLKGGGGMEVIGPSISEALYATAFGLLVAIPSAMLFNYFTGRVEGMSVDINDVTSEFIDYVLREGRN